MAKIFLKLMTNTKPQIQEAQRKSSKMNTKETPQNPYTYVIIFK